MSEGFWGARGISFLSHLVKTDKRTVRSLDNDGDFQAIRWAQGLRRCRDLAGDSRAVIFFLFLFGGDVVCLTLFTPGGMSGGGRQTRHRQPRSS